LSILPRNNFVLPKTDDSALRRRSCQLHGGLCRNRFCVDCMRQIYQSVHLNLSGRSVTVILPNYSMPILRAQCVQFWSIACLILPVWLKLVKHGVQWPTKNDSEALKQKNITSYILARLTFLKVNSMPFV